uniref:Uncharacterized protein n=1 Tax=Pristionchus pacificus TaxID=54126 RepID=A0A2A6BCU8_PRIPA|eukprot:PDM63705.1 hypothetical protein PRIPAC_49678 [Pristionchus pacificus]
MLEKEEEKKKKKKKRDKKEEAQEATQKKTKRRNDEVACIFSTSIGGKEGLRLDSCSPDLIGGGNERSGREEEGGKDRTTGGKMKGVNLRPFLSSHQWKENRAENETPRENNAEGLGYGS